MNEGKIVTFYSYKGGTGRTMALANVAWILASNGLKVLAVDWDLESPGLHKFFHPFLDRGEDHRDPGVIDLINEYAWAATSSEDRPARLAPRLRPDPPARGLAQLATSPPAERSTSSRPDGRTATTPRPSPRWTGTTSTSDSAAASSSTRCAATCGGTTTTC